MGGSPCPIEVMKKVQSHMNMSEVTIAYGMTETSPVSTQCATDDPVERRVSTVGQVLPHIEIKIVDAEGMAVPRGTTGEFCKGEIAHYKIPRYIEFVPEFPMTITGKIQKFVMREQTIEKLGLKAEKTA